MQTIKATDVCVTNGTIKGGIAKGEPAQVIDYSIDGGKTWINHGIYCLHMLHRVNSIVNTLKCVGAVSSRAEQIFPVDCQYQPEW